MSKKQTNSMQLDMTTDEMELFFQKALSDIALRRKQARNRPSRNFQKNESFQILERVYIDEQCTTSGFPINSN